MNDTYAPIVADLEKVFGKASSAGFGSAVFAEVPERPTSVDAMAMKHFTAFLGPKWTADTETAWKRGWKKMYTRSGGTKTDILAELASMSDPEAKIVVPLLTDLIEDADGARRSLAAAFNHADLRDLGIYHLGDGEAMSGIMISALYTGGLACSVIALMD